MTALASSETRDVARRRAVRGRVDARDARRASRRAIERVRRARRDDPAPSSARARFGRATTARRRCVRVDSRSSARTDDEAWRRRSSGRSSGRARGRGATRCALRVNRGESRRDRRRTRSWGTSRDARRRRTDGVGDAIRRRWCSAGCRNRSGSKARSAARRGEARRAFRAESSRK